MSIKVHIYSHCQSHACPQSSVYVSQLLIFILFGKLSHIDLVNHIIIIIVGRLFPLDLFHSLFCYTSWSMAYYHHHIIIDYLSYAVVHHLILVPIICGCVSYHLFSQYAICCSDI
jgi:hypothetical protein